VRDYVFDFDRMLAFDGNTAPYLQYAYARIRSIFRQDSVETPSTDVQILLAEPTNGARHRAHRLCRTAVLRGGRARPNRLCAYLYGLATAFSGFYENCPILRSEGPVRSSRLALAALTARTLQLGLSLLGIDVPEQM